jgi:hypothetical protein
MVESTSTYAIGAYHHYICEFKSCSWWGVLDTTLCDKVCHWLGVGLWFSVGTLVFSTNKTDRHYVESDVKHLDPNPNPRPPMYEIRKELSVVLFTNRIAVNCHMQTKLALLLFVFIS